MPKECNVCHGRVTQQETTYTLWYQGQLYVIEHVLTWVCEVCGETYYDPDVVARLQKLIWAGETPIRVINASVYEWSA